MSANCAHIENAPDAPATDRRFPVAAGILFGLGLGVFFDGIVLHQILQWHHMVTSAGFPADSVENIEINTFFDGLFHASSYVFVVSGLLLLWRSAHKSSPVVGREDARRNDPDGIRALQPGGGHGTMNHHLLGLHHVNETVPRDQWIYWDAGFLLWGSSDAGWRMVPAEGGTAPIAGGALYNQILMVRLFLPLAALEALMRSRSSCGGGAVRILLFGAS